MAHLIGKSGKGDAYGVNSFSMQIDGSTGSTLLNTIHNNEKATMEDWINSFNGWNYLYAESGSGKFKVMYKGVMKNNEIIDIDTEYESIGILLSEFVTSFDTF